MACRSLNFGPAQISAQRLLPDRELPPDQNPRLNPPYSYVNSSGSVLAWYSAQV